MIAWHTTIVLMKYVSLLSIFVVKLQHLYYVAPENKGIPN